MLLQIARCSIHHSGALLLEARDGEFLDAQLCSTSIAASNHLQQPDPGSEAAPQAEGGPPKGNDFPSDGPEAFGSVCDDDGGGGYDGGDDYMYQEAAEQHENNMPGGHYSCLIGGIAALLWFCYQFNSYMLHCTLHSAFMLCMQASSAEHCGTTVICSMNTDSADMLQCR